MGLSDKLKLLGDKAKETAAEHKDQINQAVENAAGIADRRTGGKYSDKISRATQKTGAYVERLTPEQEHDRGTPPSGPAAPPQ